MVKDTVLKSGKLMEKKVYEKSLVQMNTISDMIRSNLKLKSKNHLNRFNSLINKHNDHNKKQVFEDATPKSQNMTDLKFHTSLEKDQNVSVDSLINMYNSVEEITMKINVGAKDPVILNQDYTDSRIPERLEEQYDTEQGYTKQKEETELNREKESPIKTDPELSNQILTPEEEMRRRIEQKISKTDSKRVGLSSSKTHKQSQINSKIKFEQPDFEQSYIPFNFSKTQKFLKTKGTNCVTLNITLCLSICDSRDHSYCIHSYPN